MGWLDTAGKLGKGTGICLEDVLMLRVVLPTCCTTALQRRRCETDSPAAHLPLGSHSSFLRISYSHAVIGLRLACNSCRTHRRCMGAGSVEREVKRSISPVRTLHPVIGASGAARRVEASR